ncbi:MAG TPA: protocatechuate 3,4-dioxygenase subunit alpha [Candidatus Acidoferrum sp.]|nr:protocatechuate 3,4-dioxygenase subunit alpha [Candidatus Acidoferrum sp.]
MSLQATTSQTVGPYFSIGLTRLRKVDLVGAGVSGERVTIAGRVVDGDGNPVSDALLEIWQANSHGKYAHPEDNQNKPLEPGFQGYGRMGVDENGRFAFTTVKPGAVPSPDGKMQAPHIAISVFARGLLLRLVTRIYFPEESANADDPILNLIEHARRGTLIARKTAVKGALEWDVILQGAGETVFFDC